MYDLYEEPPKTEKYKNPKHNKLRLVVAVDGNGKASSYFHVDNSEAQKIFKLIKYIMTLPHDKWFLLWKIAKSIRIHRSTMERIVRLISGVLWADMKQENGKYEVLIPGRILFMKNSVYNPKRNLPKVRLPYRPATRIRRGEI